MSDYFFFLFSFWARYDHDFDWSTSYAIETFLKTFNLLFPHRENFLSSCHASKEEWMMLFRTEIWYCYPEQHHCIYTLPTTGWALCRRNITVATRLMQSTSNELSTSVSDSAKSKQLKLDTYPLISKLIWRCKLGIRVCHQLDIKLDGFRFRLGASHASSHIEELWYNEAVWQWVKICT